MLFCSACRLATQIDALCLLPVQLSNDVIVLHTMTNAAHDDHYVVVLNTTAVARGKSARPASAPEMSKFGVGALQSKMGAL